MSKRRIFHAEPVAEEPSPIFEPQHEPGPIVYSNPPRQIRVLQHYRGRRTGEQLIQPGIYDKEDPALFGLAEYLMQHGFAEALYTE